MTSLDIKYMAAYVPPFWIVGIYLESLEHNWATDGTQKNPK